MLVDKIMTKGVITVTPGTKVMDAIEMIRQRHIRHLPVVDEAGGLLGMVTDRDLRALTTAVRYSEAELATKTVEEIMLYSVPTANPLDHIDDAARLLYELKLSALPVIQSGELVGIVTETDVLRALVELLGVTRPGTILEVELPDEPGMLAEVTRIVSGFGVNINSIYMVPGSQSQQKQITFRLEAFDLGPIITSLKKVGCQVIWPEVKEF